MKELLNSLPQVGAVVWLGIRPDRRVAVGEVETVQLDREQGVVGDHFRSAPRAKRQVTLFQYEHLAAVRDLLHVDAVCPSALRRNIVVRGINLLALKQQEFRIGDALLHGTGPCPPCSRMEENLGPGGYNAMRGHGGITARVVQSGWVKLGDAVLLHPQKADSQVALHPEVNDES